MLFDNLAFSKFKSKDLDGLPEQFYDALKIRDSLKQESGIILNKIHLSEYCCRGSSVSCTHDFETRIVFGRREFMLKVMCVTIQLITPKIRCDAVP